MLETPQFAPCASRVVGLAAERFRQASISAAGILLLGLSLVSAVASAQNQVAVENNLAGTANWRLTAPATNRQIEGYASATSVNRGDTISLYVNTASTNFDLEVFRMGWYQGLGARRVLGPIRRPGQVQVVPTPNATNGLVDCNWVESYALPTRDPTTGAPWSTGVYLVRLTELVGNRQAYIMFVVRDDSQRPDVIFQLPVTTYQAYNFWGGKSLYSWGSGSALPWGTTTGTAARKVSFNRPYAGSTNPAAAYGNGAGEFLTNVQPVAQGFGISSAGWDYNMVRWLERLQFNVGYVTNVDVHRSPSRLLNTNVFLSSGHDEYWSWQMRANVEAARNSGVNLAFFSANTAYWQIRFEASPTTAIPDRVIAGYKQAIADPFFTDSDPSNDRFVTVRFRDPPVSLPEETLIGSQYFDTGPIDGDLIVSNASHWVFQGTGLTNQQRLVGLLGYEAGNRQGSEPASTVTLTSTPIAGANMAMTLYTAASGARVFSTGSIQFSWGLDDFNAPVLRSSRLSDAAGLITSNVLRAFGAQPAIAPPSGGPVTAQCVRLTSLSAINGGAWASAAEIDLVDGLGLTVSKAGWSVASFDSQETAGENGAATNAIDGLNTTMWHTRWLGGSPVHPHFIAINLGQLRTLSELQYLPRQDGGLNGTILRYQVDISSDCANWTRVSEGTWASNTTRKSATFTSGGNTAPTVTITSPASGTTFTTNDTVTLVGSATDAQDGSLTASMTWSSNLDGLLGSGASVGAVLRAGTHTITASVTDSGGLTTTRAVSFTVVSSTGVRLASCVRLAAFSAINGGAWTSAAEIDLLDGQGQLISKAGWSVASFDSQEATGENGRATNAIDGQAGTIWHTQWLGGSPAHPHFIAINLGQQRSLTGLQYLPRQDGGVNGTILRYQVDISPDCASWTRVADGTWAADTTRKSAVIQ